MLNVPEAVTVLVPPAVALADIVTVVVPIEEMVVLAGIPVPVTVMPTINPSTEETAVSVGEPFVRVPVNVSAAVMDPPVPVELAFRVMVIVLLIESMVEMRGSGLFVGIPVPLRSIPRTKPVVEETEVNVGEPFVRLAVNTTEVPEHVALGVDAELPPST